MVYIFIGVIKRDIQDYFVSTGLDFCSGDVC